MASNQLTATLTITNCEQCPHLKIGMGYSLDGFDHGNDWHCTKANKQISAFVEWRESDKPKGLPMWCPLLPKKDKVRRG